MGGEGRTKQHERLDVIVKIEKWLDHEIRFVFKNGEWWAVAKDVAEALGYRGSNDMTKRMDKTEISSFDWKKKANRRLRGML